MTLYNNFNLKAKFRQFFAYYLVQQKTAFAYIPKLMLCMLCFAVLLAGFIFAGSKLLYKNESPVSKVKIALVAEDNNAMIDLAVHYIENMDSVESICEFFIMEYNEAYQKLRNGDVYAVVYLPPDFIKHILNGQNTPAQITLHPDSGADSILFETLASAAAYTLRTAQAGIYAGIDTAAHYNRNDSIKQITNDLNEEYINLALRRSRMFDLNEISATKSLSIADFYTSSAFILLLLLSGIGCSSFYKNNSRFLCKMITRHGINTATQIVIQGLAISVCYFTLFGIPYLFYSITMTDIDVAQLLLIFLPTLFTLIFSICEFVLLIFNISKNPQTGVLLLFFASIVMIFLSGGILPSVFLPETVQNISLFLPSGRWLDLSTALFSGEVNAEALIMSLGFAVIFILLNYYVNRTEKR